jgi:hypothetical protein
MQLQLEMAVGKGNNFIIINKCCSTPAALMWLHVVPPYAGYLSHHTDSNTTDAALSDYNSSQLY